MAKRGMQDKGKRKAEGEAGESAAKKKGKRAAADDDDIVCLD